MLLALYLCITYFILLILHWMSPEVHVLIKVSCHVRKGCFNNYYLFYQCINIEISTFPCSFRRRIWFALFDLVVMCVFMISGLVWYPGGGVVQQGPASRRSILTTLCHRFGRTQFIYILRASQPVRYLFCFLPFRRL